MTMTAQANKLPRARLKNRHRKRGFNLVEAAIVLGIVGLVIGGIWVAASSVNEKHVMAQDQAMLLQIVERSRALFKHTTIGALLTAQQAVDMGIVTPDRLSGGVLVMPSGGSISITPSGNGTEVGVTINWPAARSLSRCLNMGARLASVSSLRQMVIMKADYSMTMLQPPITMAQVQAALTGTTTCPALTALFYY